MENNTQKGGGGDNSAGYSFSNFYCHPGFFGNPDNEIMKQIFGSSEKNFAPTDKDKEAPGQASGTKIENP